MNNYCTNCGKKLEKEELVCKKCNTPIVDLPYNYEYKSPKRRRTIKKILIIIGICILAIIVSFFVKIAIDKIKINKLKKDYVEPYLKENYKNFNYTIEYESSGKCIISGDCYYSPFNGCDDENCQEYTYLDENECKSYYYSVKTDTDEFIVTVVNRNKQLTVVEGRNIYGLDKKNNQDMTDEMTDDEFPAADNIYNYSNNKIIIEKYPYESNYYDFSLQQEKNQIYLDNNGMSINFFAGKLYDNSKFYISGDITNPMYLKGYVYINTKYYDINYNELGICKDVISLLGEGYSNIAFSCLIQESDLANNKTFEDIKYYKINISSLEIEN